MTSPSCVFCQIVAGTSPAHIVWEDDDHVAFLSIFPNTPGVTVVIPRAHHPSYAFALPDDVFDGLTHAARAVGRLLDDRLDGVGRTGLVYEGFGVDHVHAKLFPMHGTDLAEWRAINSDIETWFDAYPGYISTHDAARCDDAELARVASLIRDGSAAPAS